ncbi:MAG: hypothetical protein ABSF57_10280, partial [Acidobacteriaceae bacterium]
MPIARFACQRQVCFPAMHAEVLQLRRQVGHVQHRPRRERAGALDRILQLTHIARPVVLGHQPDRILAEDMGGAGLAVHPLQEVRGQHGDVVPAFAQRRQLEVDHTEAE